jgi:hypothetical protein
MMLGGLGERFSAVPHRVMQRLQPPLRPGAGLMIDLGLLPGPHRHIAMVPQWDFLDLLADAGREEPSFTLRMGVDVVGLLREHGRVVGVRYRDPDGADGEPRHPARPGGSARPGLRWREQVCAACAAAAAVAALARRSPAYVVAIGVLPRPRPVLRAPCVDDSRRSPKPRRSPESCGGAVPAGER